MAETAENWDLHAVVRSCSSSAIDATTSSSKYAQEKDTTDAENNNNNNNNNPLSFLSSLKFEEEEDPFCFPNLLQEERNNGLEELQDSYKPFFPTNIGRDDIILSSSSSSSCVLGGLTSQQQQQQHHHHQQQLTTSISTSTDSPLTPTTSSPIFVFGEPKSQRSRHVQQRPQLVQQDLQLQQQQLQPSGSNCLRPTQSQAPARSRKRKTPQKRMVCHVTAENLSADLWAWRKYGQKPIKGSPYPRNYYRCSSSKGCAARKQVERSNTDPNIFIVSYTGDHTHPRPTHRNSLAGSSRNKFSRAHQNSPSKDNPTSAPPPVAKPSCSSPLLSSRHSLTAPEEEKNSTVENSQPQGAADMDSTEMVMEEFDDEDELLIPNLAAAMNEDLFKRFDATSPSNSI